MRNTQRYLKEKIEAENTETKPRVKSFYADVSPPEKIEEGEIAIAKGSARAYAGYDPIDSSKRMRMVPV